MGPGDIGGIHYTFSATKFYNIAMTTKASDGDTVPRVELELALFIAKRKTGSVKGEEYF